MKSLVISVILLVAVVGGVIANIIYVCGETDTLTALARELEAPSGAEEPASKEALARLRTQWQRAKGVMTYFIDYREVDRADESFKELESSFEANDAESFEVYRADFIHAVERIREISVVSAENIM